MMIFHYFFYLLIIFFTFQVLINKDSFQIIIICGLLSYFSVIQYILLNSPDVAITEASIGACLSTIFALKFLSQVHNTHYQSQDEFSFKTIFLRKNIIKFIIFIIFLCMFFISFYLMTINSANEKLSIFGDLNEKTYNETTLGYIEKTKNSIQIKNIVTAVLAFFRGFDTLIETLVILTAGAAVYFVLSESSKESIDEKDIKNEEISKSFIIHRLCFFFIPFIVLFAFYIQVHGEESPGGGFQAGAILTCAFILYSIIISEDAVLNFFSIKTLLRIGAFGILIYFSVGMFPLLKNFFSGFLSSESNLFLNYDHLLCSEQNLFDQECLIKSRKLGIFLVELGVGICVFAVTLALFLNLKLFKEPEK